jgi:ankyrin repeat protein
MNPLCDEEVQQLNSKFLRAAYCGDVETIAECVNANVNMDTADKQGWTGLHHAVLADNPEIIDLLLNEGSTTDWINKKGETALLVAAKKYKVQSGITLLEWGADANAADHTEQTALHHVAKKSEEHSFVAPAYEYTLKRSAFGSRKEEKDYKKFARLYVKALDEARQMEEQLLEEIKADKEQKQFESEAIQLEEEERTNHMSATEAKTAHSASDEKEEFALEDDMTEEEIAERAQELVDGFDADAASEVLSRVGLLRTLDVFEEATNKLSFYVRLKTDELFHLDTDRKVECIFYLCLSYIGTGDIHSVFLDLPEVVYLQLGDVEPARVTLNQLRHPALLDSENLHHLRLYACLRFCGLDTYWPKLSRFENFDQITTVDLRAMQMDLTDNLRFILFCKLLHVPLRSYFPIDLDREKKHFRIDPFLSSDVLALDPNERIRLCSYLCLQRLKLEKYYHRIEAATWKTNPCDAPSFNRFELSSLFKEATVEKLRVLVSLKLIDMENKFTPFISAGYVKMEYFRMANEHDLVEVGLTRKERETFIQYHLLCPLTMKLCQVHANVNAKDKEGYTPLHWAARKGNADVARVLLMKGADKNSIDSLKRTPLHLAALNNWPNVCRVLLLGKAKKSPVDCSRNTPMHTGCKYNSVDSVLLMAKMGCNSVLTNKAGEQPIDVARRVGAHLCEAAILKFAVANGYDSD